MKQTVRLSKKEMVKLSKYGADFHTALGTVLAGHTDHKDIISKLEDLETQIESLKSYSN